jgi:SAM-dependent methyltransferase
MPPLGYYGNPRDDVLALLPDKVIGAALEIGGGDFPTLAFIGRQHECETWGVDVRPTSANIDHIITGSFVDQNVFDRIPAGTFDLVIANDVIEHIADTEQFVANVLSSMAPGAILLLSVPNIRQIRTLYHIFWRGSFPRESAGLYDETHLRWFCKKDIISLFGQKLELLSAKSVGRIVPAVFSGNFIGELLGLQNIFCFRKNA